MKEVTTVITCEVTKIVHIDDNTAAKMEQMSEEERQGMAKAMETDLNADNVVVTDHKAFIREEETE